MIGDSALALVQDSARSQSTGLLRPYLDESVRHLARETRSLNAQLQAGQEVLTQIENDDASVCQLTVAALTMRRNKRALMVYHAQRLELLRDLFWDPCIGSGASNLASLLSSTTTTSNSNPTKSNISPSESDFLKSYGNLMREYKSAFLSETTVNGGIDLSGGNLERPPKELHCQVRVLKDVGEIETEEGSISFRKGSLVFVRRTDVEKLIAAGILEEVVE